MKEKRNNYTFGVKTRFKTKDKLMAKVKIQNPSQMES